MKTKTQAVTEYALYYKDNSDIVFKQGIEFAEQWINVKDELPKENIVVLTKGRFGAQTAYMEDGIWYQNRFNVAFNQEDINEWRPIELN